MAKYLDETGLAYFWAKVKEKLAMKADSSALATKQDAITGTQGQIVGFGADGKPAAQDAPSSLPPGGTPGQVLAKSGAADYDAGWEDAPGTLIVTGEEDRENGTVLNPSHTYAEIKAALDAGRDVILKLVYATYSDGKRSYDLLVPVWDSMYTDGEHIRFVSCYMSYITIAEVYADGTWWLGVNYTVLQSNEDYVRTIESRWYTGTGTYGADNPCSLTFDRIPKLLYFYGSSGTYYTLYVCPRNSQYYKSNAITLVTYENSKTITWYGTSAAYQNNTAGQTYTYMVFY